MSTQMEYTDRYGGHAPSWLRACLAGCEAMGCSPKWRGPRTADGTPLIEAVAADGDDNWEWVRCASCGGSGRVPYWRTILRLPRWLARGVRFIWSMGVVRNKEVRPPHWTWWHQFRVTMAVAFLVDLGLWRP